jgi:hypothetical protein
MAISGKGLYKKYNIAHADGSPVDPNAQYFVLRIDGSGENVNACRKALAAFALSTDDYELQKDICNLLLSYVSNGSPKSILSFLLSNIL